MAILYSYNTLADLLAVNVTTLVDGSPRLVKDDSWYQYNATATTGGYAPDVGSGRWFRLSGVSGVGLSEIKTGSFTASPFGDYVVNSTTDITLTYPASPIDGTSISFITINTGRVNSQFGTFINGSYRVDAYFAKDKYVKLIYASTLGWVCPTTDVFNGVRQSLISFWEFNPALYIYGDYVGGRDFVDTGTTPLAFTTGLVAGSNAADFNNATADYQLSQSSIDLSPTTIPWTDTLGFAFLINLVSGTEPIISQKWTSDSTKYTYAIRAIDATHIEFSIETGGTGAGFFTATVAVTAAYGVPLLIIATMPVAWEVKSPRVMSLQVGDSAGLSSVVYTAITGDFQASDSMIVGQTESSSQIVGIVDQIRVYYRELDSNQRNLLWNNGAFI